MLNICEVFPIRKNLIRNIVQTPTRNHLVNEGTKVTMSFQSFVVSAKLAAQGKVATVESISLGSPLNI